MNHYIVEVLGVDEQELFRFDIEYATEYNLRYSKEAREILYLMQYTPKPMIELIKNVMQRFKKAYEEGIREL